MTRTLSAVLALAALLLMGTTGCGPRSYTAEDNLHIVAPAPLTTVAAPFAVRWTATRGGPRSYAVFVDRTPMRPGHTVHDLADDQCKHIPGCPDSAYLAARGVFLTQSTSVTVPVLLPAGGVEAHASHPAHTLTLVVLDSKQRRAGESFWTAEFRA